MNNIADVQTTYSRIIGAVVALIGLLGFFMASPLFGLLGVNMYSNIVHLLGGLLVLWKAGKQTNMIVGWVALVVGIIGFVPYLSAITDFLGFNTNFHILHIVIGVVSLAVAKMAK